MSVDMRSDPRRRKRVSHGRSGLAFRAQLLERGPFYALCVLLVLAFLIGGASRADVPPLVVLRPVAILLLGFGLWRLRWEQVRTYRYLFAVAAAMLAVTAIQLVPLPPAIWSALPGRDVVAEIDRAAGLGAVWRPISLVPQGTWNSLFAMLVPLGVLVLGVQIAPEDRRKLLPLILLLGVISALLALLQTLGPPNGPLYLYRITNSGFAVGLFANRNHQAVLLGAMFPMLAVFASLRWGFGQDKVNAVMALAIGIFLIPLVLITGSRMGLVVAVVGIIASALLYRRGADERRQSSRKSRRHGDMRHHRPTKGLARSRWLALLIGGLVLGLGALSIALGRGEAFQRMFASEEGEDMRFRAWGTVVQMIRDYFPIGSGSGSFVEVYQLHEPRALLDSTYFNHAHNDWLEVVLTGGLPAVLILLFVCGLVIARGVQLLRRVGNPGGSEVLFARLGLVLIVQLAMASAGDYPLRTPALASLFALAALWVAAPLLGLAGAEDAGEARIRDV